MPIVPLGSRLLQSINSWMKISILFTFIGCVVHDPAPSDTKITNGLLDLGDPSVFLLQSTSLSTGQKHLCTSTLIRPDVLLTAAHCVEDADTRKTRLIQIAMPSAPSVVSVKIHPKYEAKSRFDVAILRLERPILGKAPVPLAKNLPQKDDQVRLVGFGDNHHAPRSEESTGSGVKRTGYSTVTVVDDHFIYSRGIREAKPVNTPHPTGVDSAAAHGDSGGPLLNLHGEIVGIACAINASTRAADADPKRPVISAYTQVDAVRDFINTTP